MSADNAVKLIDAFVDKPDLQKLGFTKTIHSAEGRPPYAPAVLFLPCRTQILTFNHKRSTLLLTAWPSFFQLKTHSTQLFSHRFRTTWDFIRGTACPTKSYLLAAVLVNHIGALE